MIVNIEKSKIPIVWIDTSIITNITIYKNKPKQLAETQRNRIKTLYGQLYDATRKGMVICPLAEQEEEVWINRDEWLDTINELSLGIDCLPLKGIQDNQLDKAMKAFLSGSDSIELSYTDAFYDDPVEELEETLKSPIYVTTNHGLIFGADHQKNTKAELVRFLNETREKNIKENVSFERQFELESMGELDALFQLQGQMFRGVFSGEMEEMNAFWGTLNLRGRLQRWSVLSGRENDIDGYISFYKSEHNRNCPFQNLTSNLYAKIMTDPQAIKTGDMVDIQHIASLMPFSDLFITDKAWNAFLNTKRYDSAYMTNICYVGDTAKIDRFFDSL